jgi:hypothetical protein
MNTEQQNFLEACREERNAFSKNIWEQEWSTGLRTAAESLLIMYDQLRERLVKSEALASSVSTGGGLTARHIIMNTLGNNEDGNFHIHVDHIEELMHAYASQFTASSPKQHAEDSCPHCDISPVLCKCCGERISLITPSPATSTFKNI